MMYTQKQFPNKVFLSCRFLAIIVDTPEVLF